MALSPSEQLRALDAAGLRELAEAFTERVETLAGERAAALVVRGRALAAEFRRWDDPGHTLDAETRRAWLVSLLDWVEAARVELGRGRRGT